MYSASTYEYSSKVCVCVRVCYAFQMISSRFACCMFRACICLFHSFAMSVCMLFAAYHIIISQRQTQSNSNRKKATLWINIIRCLFALVLTQFRRQKKSIEFLFLPLRVCVCERVCLLVVDDTYTHSFVAHHFLFYFKYLNKGNAAQKYMYLY